MGSMIWIGTGLSLLGLLGLVYCIATVWRARSQKLSDDDMRARLQRVVAWNLGSLLTSALGLGLVAIGVILS